MIILIFYAVPAWCNEWMMRALQILWDVCNIQRKEIFDCTKSQNCVFFMVLIYITNNCLFLQEHHSSSLRHLMKILKSLYKWFAECKSILFYYFPKKFWIICLLYSFFRHWRVTSPEKEKEIPPLRVVSQSCVSLSLTKYRAGIKGCN